MTSTLASSPAPVRIWRPRLSHLQLNLCASAYMLLVLSTGFWERLLGHFPLLDSRTIVFGFGVLAASVFIQELLGPGRLQKPVLALLILASAGASYYERAFGVLMDKDMVRNIVETNYTEASHMVTPRMVAAILLTGVIPALLVFWPEVRRVGLVHQLWRWPLAVIASLGLTIGAMFMYFKDYSAMMREAGDPVAAHQPIATVKAVFRYGLEQMRGASVEVAPYGRDARKGSSLSAAEKPVLMVFFLGETARAQSFGLNGYARNTTPELARRDVIAFTGTTSCGTSTARSVPCMFSGLGKDNFTREAGLARENLVDVLGHAGVKVEWYENNSGDQNVAVRNGWAMVDKTLDPVACATECTDEIFLPIIRNAAETITEDTVLVLHMIGNHGPAYYMRYPQERAVFQPDCRSAQFADCTDEQIVNAYDNAIHETDYVLAKSIDILAASDRVTPALVYLSDHGESLGESGVYLHASPVFMAPAEQTRVPFVMWLDPRFETLMGLDEACLRSRTGAPTSQDNLFSSMLGLMDITTTVRNPDLDLTAGCRDRLP
ncbi:phosphoethanolamine transferase [Pseudogemmobacter faecipullorum]|uniref:Sulfatase-like hydrolase/transferase n=1 Tax=Pseudogemmobacter faecipullorum TaxID=2755041 RepID=A0ABS8CMX7_9RHOB|nr:sulfatase-like hydrolase/transferase [Pseudogemmobacter faecipullorum]MCB5410696.1 sulfatase-like hydrolase/transferase [Pseudogemmobacter faecipullorum]